MGDRVLVQVESDEGGVSPVLYLHWGGSIVTDLIRETAELMKGRDNAVSYAFARLVGGAHVRVPGNLSVGVWNHADRLVEKDTHGDAGCYVVNCVTWEVEAFGGYGQSFNAREGEAE